MMLNSYKMKKYLVVSMLLLIIITSCSTQKKYITSNNSEAYNNLSNNRYSYIQDNAFNFKYLTANYEAEYTEDETTTSFSGQLRMRYDSIIWLSVNTFLGIEVSRIIITTDSVKIIDRIHSTHIYKDSSYLQITINPAIDIFMLQSLITANDIKNYDTTSFVIDDNNNELIFSCFERKNRNKESGFSLNNSIIFDKSLKKITKHTLTSSSKSIIVLYKNFIKIEDQSFPSEININIITSPKKNLFLTFKSIKLNNITTFPFKVPARYEPSK